MSPHHADTGLSVLAVKQLVYEWFARLTDHAPLAEMEALLNVDRVEMTFPETTVNGQQEFRAWYDTVSHKFFDQVHELKMLHVEVAENLATVHLVVNWQARTWDPPQGFSDWVGAYADQVWTVEPHRETGVAAITTYRVTRFVPMSGPLKIG